MFVSRSLHDAGAMFISQNIITTNQTKQIDICTKYVEDGIIKIMFVKSTDNDREIMTKGLSGDLFQNIKRDSSLQYLMKIPALLDVLWKIEQDRE
jgi:hypothetical protein